MARKLLALVALPLLMVAAPAAAQQTNPQLYRTIPQAPAPLVQRLAEVDRATNRNITIIRPSGPVLQGCHVTRDPGSGSPRMGADWIELQCAPNGSPMILVLQASSIRLFIQHVGPSATGAAAEIYL